MPRKGEDRWTWRIALLGGSGLELIEQRSGQYLYVVNYSSHNPLSSYDFVSYHTYMVHMSICQVG